MTTAAKTTEAVATENELKALRRAVWELKGFRKKWATFGYPPPEVMDYQVAQALAIAETTP